jgi:hypothetical protein
LQAVLQVNLAANILHLEACYSLRNMGLRFESFQNSVVRNDGPVVKIKPRSVDTLHALSMNSWNTTVSVESSESCPEVMAAGALSSTFA